MLYNYANGSLNCKDGLLTFEGPEFGTSRISMLQVIHDAAGWRFQSHQDSQPVRRHFRRSTEQRHSAHFEHVSQIVCYESQGRLSPAFCYHAHSYSWTSLPLTSNHVLVAKED